MSDLIVRADGWLVAGGERFYCALGRSGIVVAKREGDGGTPAGRLSLREVLYRPDRRVSPRTRLPVSAIAAEDGWCDDAAHPDYNRRVKLPHPARCEHLWRNDAHYDLLAVLGYNDAPPKPGLGSAIFLHIAAPGYAPTAGCVAVGVSDLENLLARVEPGDAVEVRAP